MRRRDFLQGMTLAAAHLNSEAQAARPPTEQGGRPYPRLYFDRARIAALRQRLKNEAGLKEQWARFLARAEALLKDALISERTARGPVITLDQGTYLQPGSQIAAMGMTLGLAYHVTEQERFAQKLREALLHYSQFSRWEEPHYAQRVPPWNSGLNTDRFCWGFALGYDTLRDFLPAEERARVAKALIRLGILPTLEDWALPERRIHALDSMGHNWWTVCIAGAGVAALSLAGDEARALEWVRQVDSALDQWFGYRGNVLQNKPVNFDSAGAFYEGVHYTSYPLLTYLRYRLAHSNVLPKSKQTRIPVLEQAAQFLLHTFYPISAPVSAPASPSFLTVNFGDSGLHENCATTMRLLAANGFDVGSSGAAIRWYLKRQDLHSSDALAMLYPISSGSASIQSLPPSVSYPEIGWALLRSSWEDDATLLAVKAGDTWNHAHADAGSFILFHGGAPLIIDSGVCSYNRPEYGTYYRLSKAHNVVLFNGEGQSSEDIERGARFPGRIHSLLDGLGLKYVYADATGPMARHLLRNFRHWLWLDGAILIFDDLRAHEAGRFDWLLHYEGTANLTGNEVVLRNGQASAALRLLFPESVTAREEGGFANQEPDRKVSYFAFSPTKPAQEEKFVVAVLPLVEGRALPKLELLTGSQMIGVRLRQAEQITDVYLNLQADGRRMHLNSNNVMDGWETDAYLLALTRPATSQASTPQTVRRYFVSAGSYLRKDGQVVLDSLSQVTALFRPGQRMEVALRGQQLMDAALRAADKPAALVVNGRAETFDYDARRQLVRFRTGGL